MEHKALTTRGRGGMYSTADLGNGMLETMFFPDDESQQPRVVARSSSIERFHKANVEADYNGANRN